MADETQSVRHNGNPQAGYQGNQAPERSMAETIQSLTESSKQLFEAGQRLTKSLNELQQRVARATDWRAQVSERPWLMAGLAVAGGIILWRLISHRSED